MRSFDLLKYAVGRNFLYKNILVQCLGMKSPAKGSVDCKLTGYMYHGMIKKKRKTQFLRKIPYPHTDVHVRLYSPTCTHRGPEFTSTG